MYINIYIVSQAAYPFSLVIRNLISSGPRRRRI